jgi:hypothetical protein
MTMDQSRIYVICSPRPRVGKTLLARLMCEFLHSERRPASAFDVNPDNPDLLGFQPEKTVAATIDDTLGQVALFDRLIVADGMVRIVDLGHRSFERFFSIAEEIGLFAEAQRRGIAAVTLFVADDAPASVRAYAALCQHFPTVPVHNESLMPPRAFRDAYPTGAVPLRFPTLSPELRPLVDGAADARAGRISDVSAAQLDSWRRRAFIAVREFELSLLLDNLRHAI